MPKNGPSSFLTHSLDELYQFETEAAAQKRPRERAWPLVPCALPVSKEGGSLQPMGRCEVDPTPLISNTKPKSDLVVEIFILGWFLKLLREFIPRELSLKLYSDLAPVLESHEALQCHPKMVDFEVWNLFYVQFAGPRATFSKTPRLRFLMFPEIFPARHGTIFRCIRYVQDAGDLAADTPLIDGAGGTQLR